MLQVQQEGNRSIIDVREAMRQGLHPRNEIVEFVRHCPNGSIVEIHLPHPAPPLVGTLESLGLHCVINELEPGHFRLVRKTILYGCIEQQTGSFYYTWHGFLGSALFLLFN